MFERRIIANSRGFHYGNGKMGITGVELICINTHSRDYFIIQPSNKQPARFLHVVVCLDFPLDVCVFWCGLVSTPFFCARIKCRLLLPTIGGLRDTDMLCRAICVCIECNAPSLKAACTLNLYGKVQAAFFKRKYGKTVHKTTGKIVWNRHCFGGKY